MADYGFDQIQCQMPSMRELVLAVQKEHLARMYRLFNRIKNGLEPVALIFRKHVVDLGWSIKFCAQGTSRASAAAPSSNIASKDDEQDPAMTSIASLLSLFQVCGLFLAG